jgi:hypothetical protein
VEFLKSTTLNTLLQTENGLTGNGNFRLCAANGKRKFVFLGRTINNDNCCFSKRAYLNLRKSGKKGSACLLHLAVVFHSQNKNSHVQFWGENVKILNINKQRGKGHFPVAIFLSSELGSRRRLPVACSSTDNLSLLSLNLSLKSKR